MRVIGWEERKMVWKLVRHGKEMVRESGSLEKQGGGLTEIFVGRWSNAVCHPPGGRDSS